MKKGILLNGEILSVIGRMGHTDTIVIADAGLPIPEGVRRIDLAVTCGTPGFTEVLEALMAEYACEGMILAEEIEEHNQEVHGRIRAIAGETPITYCSHEAFKEATARAKAVIRTGECTPYANVILRSGVTF
jgi:D-ribose pyranase